jgi:hypothetical protein
MAAKNNITGDEIKSKSLSSKGRENWDKIFAKKPATEWAEMKKIVILDPDGFRYDDGVTVHTPISYSEFSRRINECTCMFEDFYKNIPKD